MRSAAQVRRRPGSGPRIDADAREVFLVNVLGRQVGDARSVGRGGDGIDSLAALLTCF